MSETYRPVHAYGGREHDQPAPVEGCLLCRLEAVEAHADHMRQLAHRLEEESVDHAQLARVAGAFIIQARDKHGLGRFFPDELSMLDEMARLARLTVEAGS